MRRVAGILVSLVALGEIAVGVVLVLFPETVVEFLLGARVGPSGTLIARMAALAITALGLAWWEDRNSHDRARLRQVAIGFVGYNVGVGLLFLAYAWGADRLLPFAWLVGIAHTLAGIAFAVVVYRTPPVATTG